jgi:hypothetical protein
MHFEILIEDVSGKKMLEAVMPKIIGISGAPHTWRIISYKGIGHIPKNLRTAADPAQRHLLDQLPRLLAGYGKSFPASAGNAAVVVVLDNDRNDCVTLLQKLNAVLASCATKPKTMFRIAIEECEAWLLGDPTAIQAAYPRVKNAVLTTYAQDRVCGTWEKLADAVHPGGASALTGEPYFVIGKQKCEWAERIGKHLDVERNRSPSFGKLRDGLRRLAQPTGESVTEGTP